MSRRTTPTPRPWRVVWPVPLALPGLELDLETLGAAFSDRTAMVVVNTPHNPTGAQSRSPVTSPPFSAGDDGAVSSAELPAEVKNAISHRGRATRELARLLAEMA